VLLFYIELFILNPANKKERFFIYYYYYYNNNLLYDKKLAYLKTQKLTHHFSNSSQEAKSPILKNQNN
jgi:hypothetical protein